MKNNNLSLIVSILILVVVAACFVILNLSLKANNAEKEEESKGRAVNLLGANIAYIEGAVEYKESKGEWKRAEQGTNLFQGYSVEVIGAGRAIVNLDNGSALRLNSDSSITLTSMNPSNIVVTNDEGEIYSRVIKSESAFTVKAGDAFYKSMGTAYSTINNKNKNGVEVYQSEVKVQEGEKKETTVKEGKKYFVLNKNNSDLQGKIKRITDAEIKKDKFISWNKNQDETNKQFKKNMGVLEFDETPPAITIISPENGTETEADSITVKGKTESGAKVLINGEKVENNNGEFSGLVYLKEGTNTININAIDGSGNKATKTLTVKKSSAVVVPEPTEGISLYGKSVDNGISFSWTVSGINTDKGFKLVKSKTSNPVYPGNSYVYLSKGEQRSYVWGIVDGRTYNFRICRYDGDGACGTYSNNIQITAPKKDTSYKDKDDDSTSNVSSITLSGTGKKVSWAVKGTSSKGFKLVWSKKSEPTYPTRSGDKYQYYSDFSKRSGEVYAFDGSGKYYVRVCEYLGGKCGTYSNQIQITL